VNKRLTCLLLSYFLASPLLVLADTDVNVVGLFSGKALLIINKGKPLTMSAGQVSPLGVKLISADSKKAVLEIDGVRKELAMGQAAIVAGNAPVSENGSVTVYADNTGHYFTEGSINGYTRKFIVDTGASTVVMNSSDAANAGIDFTKGALIPMQTASGLVHGYQVSITTIKIRDLVLHQVDGVVLEGDSPTVVLLGMSVLNRVDIKREGIALTLTKKY